MSRSPNLGLGLRQPAAAFSSAACCGEPMNRQRNPIGSSFSTHSLLAAGCAVKSGSRLPQSK